MKTYKKVLAIIAASVIAASIGFAFTAQGATVIPELWKRVNFALLPVKAGDTVGATSTPIYKGFFTNLSVTNAPSFGAFGDKAVIYSAAGTLAADINNFVYDYTNQRLGIGTSSPYLGNLVVESTANTTNTFLTGSTAGSMQINTQNRSSDVAASTDIVATNNIGNDSSYYINLGIDSSTYNQAGFTITGVNDGYLYNSDGNLAIGTATSTAAASNIKFFTGGTLAANERMRIDSTGKVGIGTVAPTHPLTFSSQAVSNGGIALYNTSDQVTNFERLRIATTTTNGQTWSISSDAAGSGVSRPIRFTQGGASIGTLIMNMSAGLAGLWEFSRSTGGTNYSQMVIDTATGNQTAPNGNVNFFQISPGVAQTGTAGYTGFLMAIGENSVGSGAKTLVDLQVGNGSATTSLWKIDDKGHVIGGGTAPTLTSCGTSPAIAGNDHAGTVTGGTGSAGCTMTFANTYASTPHCTVTAETGSLVNSFSYVASSSGMAITETGLGTGKYDYICIQ